MNLRTIQLYALISLAWLFPRQDAAGYTSMGAGTAALSGGDLTDPENNGVDGASTGWKWVSIVSSSENYWTAEGAFNIFDNKVGAADDKWCCDGPPQWIAVQFERPYVLTHFTIAAGNDAPQRDPTRWNIEGSNDGIAWTPIYQWSAGSSPFSARLEVLRFDGNGADFPAPPPWRWFRYQVLTNDDALHQINELELFGVAVQVIRDFSAENLFIPPREPVTLGWKVDPATTSVSISGVGNVMAQTVNGVGSIRVAPGPAASTTYTLTATHPLTTATQSLTVAVSQQPIIRSFAAAPAIIGPGTGATLSWDVINSNSIQLDGVTVTGTSQVVAPAFNTTYTLTATNEKGMVSAQTTISVVVPGVPVISEFMADNDGARLVDADGSKSDWIELHNPSGTSAQLEGYFLTDSPTQLGKWAFPQISLAPGAWMVIFASGKDRRLPGAALHTNFSLNADGEYLALVKPDGMTIVSEFGSAGADFPSQNKGVSFGRFGIPVQDGYFSTATPGAANSGGFSGYVKDTKFSVNRGFYNTPRTLTISSGTQDAQIRYTTDGSWPTETTGLLYSQPITITRTMPVRAMACKTGFRPTNVDTHTYVFVDDVITQTPDTTQSTWELPAAWGGQTPDYGMDPRVTTLHNATIRDDLKRVPTLSVVCDSKDMFDPAGAYSNPNSSGPAWERRISLEMIDPADPGGGNDFQLNCGLRIQGGAFRSFSLTPKKAFRVLFKSDYGPSKLRYPLFGEDAAKEFDTLILRMESNDGYQWDNRTDVQYARDEFGRRTALDLGMPSSHGRFLHLYINGVYWGIFNVVERPDSAFGESYFGADKDLWDGINFGTATNEGSTVPWNTMVSLLSGITSASNENGRTAALMKAQGLNPDGSRNPAWADYINIDNFIDYLLVNWYTGNADWPHRNYYTGRERDLLDPPPLRGVRTSTGMHFFMWDVETSMLLNSSNDKTGDTNGVLVPYGHLRKSLEFRARFADRAHRALFNDGALTKQKCLDRYAAITKDHRSILIPELARWGDQHGTLRTLAQWQNAYDSVRNNWLSVRTPGLVNILKGAGLYPQTDAPTFSQQGGSVLPATPITMASNADKIYYTTDGRDPRAPGGAPAAAALVADFGGGGPLPVTYLNTGSVWKYLDNGSDQGNAWTAPGFNDAAWASGPSSLGYGADGEGGGTTIGFGGNTAARHATTYFRTTVNISDPTLFLNFLLRLKYDDGAAVYLNGMETVRTDNLPAGADYRFYTGTTVADETSWKDFTLPVSRFVKGSNTLAVEIHQASAGSSDIRMDLLLRGEVSSGGSNVSNPLFFNTPTLLSARSYHSGTGEWSALNTALFSIDSEPASAANLVISEFSYRPSDPATAPELAVSADRDDYEFIELLNIGPKSIDLSGVEFAGGIVFPFPDATFMPTGGRLVVVNHAAAFRVRYGAAAPIVIAGDFASGNLANDGEFLILKSKRTGIIREFSYDDKAPWPTAANDQGFSLVLIAPAANPSHQDPSHWRSSVTVNGSPGVSDSIGYASWKQARSITSDHADPDNDGLANFLEYALGTAPDVASPVGLPGPRLLRHTNGADYAGIAITRNPATADDVELIVETSDNLAAWQPDAVYLGETREADTAAATLLYRAPQPAGTGTRRYLRARFVHRE